jgi:hypothetical protein
MPISRLYKEQKHFEPKALDSTEKKGNKMAGKKSEEREAHRILISTELLQKLVP